MGTEIEVVYDDGSIGKLNWPTISLSYSQACAFMLGALFAGVGSPS